MSSVLGIDLSSFAVELVKLDETTSAAGWTHVHLHGGNALQRLRDLPRQMPRWGSGWYDDVYLVAIEAPYSTGQAGTLAKLSRVFGAITMCVPPRLEIWEIAPHDWRRELELPGNATKERGNARAVELGAPRDWKDENAYDAFSVAWCARQINDRGIRAA
jgi:Holliday junction resolvasome RuvABC endonuclease subunit